MKMNECVATNWTLSIFQYLLVTSKSRPNAHTHPNFIIGPPSTNIIIIIITNHPERTPLDVLLWSFLASVGLGFVVMPLYLGHNDSSRIVIDAFIDTVHLHCM
jgi:hypothetical protein